MGGRAVKYPDINCTRVQILEDVDSVLDLVLELLQVPPLVVVFARINDAPGICYSQPFGFW
jgi:hypothetical protein